MSRPSEAPSRSQAASAASPPEIWRARDAEPLTKPSATSGASRLAQAEARTDRTRLRTDGVGRRTSKSLGERRRIPDDDERRSRAEQILPAIMPYARLAESPPGTGADGTYENAATDGP